MPLCECGCGSEVRGRYQRPKVGGWRVQRFVSPGHALRVHHFNPSPSEARVKPTSGGWLGRKHTPETKAKLSAARFIGDAATQRTGRGRAEKLHPSGPCIICGRRGERHHIDGNTLNNSDLNVVLLCRKHHRTIHPGNGPRPLRPLSELFAVGGGVV